MPVVGRFAPSPTGQLHLGNLRTALASWLSVKAVGGQWLIRIEDVDIARCKGSLANAQLRDLGLLGLESDAPVLWQSARAEVYWHALERLHAAGCLYPCRCTRKDLALMASAPHETDGARAYPGLCRNRSMALLARDALRFRLPEGAVQWLDRMEGPRADDPIQLTGDPLLHRRDGCFAYHLAVVVDDGEQGVDEVVRGEDLKGVTATQIRLQEALQLPRPAYAHLGLVLAPHGARLGKRDGAAGLQGLLGKGVALAEVVGWLGWSLGCLDRPEPCKAEDLVPLFDWKRVPRGPVEVPSRWVLT